MVLREGFEPPLTLAFNQVLYQAELSKRYSLSNSSRVCSCIVSRSTVKYTTRRGSRYAMYSAIRSLMSSPCGASRRIRTLIARDTTPPFYHWNYTGTGLSTAWSSVRPLIISHIPHCAINGATPWRCAMVAISFSAQRYCGGDIPLLATLPVRKRHMCVSMQQKSAQCGYRRQMAKLAFAIPRP